MSECIFCKIAQGELATELLLERDNLVAFKDLNPQAPTHILVIPKKHIASLDRASQEDSALLGDLLLAVQEMARREDLAAGYRVVLNIGSHGGQSVPHLHFHLLGGRSLQWPPG